MSIQELFSKFKGIFTNSEYQLSALIILVAGVSFFLGTQSEHADKNITQNHINIENVAQTLETEQVSQTSESYILENASAEVVKTSGKYVASVNGTKYHLPWCSGAKQMNEENKIWFDTKADAERAGYTPAANCKGI